jgi:hypothetical protein
MADAVAWVKRSPNPMPGPSEIEIRPFMEASDFGEVLEAAFGKEQAKLRQPGSAG